MSLVYTVKEVAELFQISTSAVYQLRDEGKLIQLSGVPGVRFSKEGVHALAKYDKEFTAYYSRYAATYGGVKNEHDLSRKTRTETSKRITSIRRYC